MENIDIIRLFDIYGKLLTEKQRNTFSLYYLDDLSLREIAENNKISFQAVRDSIEVSKKQLLHFEEVIGMKELKDSIENILNEIKDKEEFLKIYKKIEKLK